MKKAISFFLALTMIVSLSIGFPMEANAAGEPIVATSQGTYVQSSEAQDVTVRISLPGVTKDYCAFVINGGMEVPNGFTIKEFSTSNTAKPLDPDEDYNTDNGKLTYAPSATQDKIPVGTTFDVVLTAPPNAVGEYTVTFKTVHAADNMGTNVLAEVEELPVTVSITEPPAAPSTPDSVEIYQGANKVEGVQNITLPGIGEDDATATYTATVKDQYDQPITDAEIEWTIAGTNTTGISVDNGTVTVTKDAAEGNYTLTATCNGKTDSITIKVEKKPVITTIVMDKNTDAITIPSVGQATGNYGCSLKDQYGENIAGSVTWSISPEGQGVTVPDSRGGQVVVSSTATAGQYSLTATCNENTAVKGIVTITVSQKASQTITCSDVTVTYGDTNKKVSATTSGTGTISYAVTTGDDVVSVDATTGALTIHKAGLAVITVTAAGNDTYATATEKITVTVKKATPAYTVPTGLSATYGETLADVELPDGWAWKDSTTSVGNAGTKSFVAIFTPADTTNYNTVEKNVTITVYTRKVTAPTAGNKTYTYNGNEQTYEFATVGDTAGYIVTGNKQTTAGDYTVTVALEDKTNTQWSDGTTADKKYSFTINPVNLTITGLTASGKTYDGKTEIALSGGTLNGVMLNDNVGFTAVGRTADENVDTDKDVTVDITLTGTDNGNYTVQPVTGLKATISPATITLNGVAANNRDYEKGDKSVTVTYTDLSGRVEGDAVNVNLTGSVETDAAGENKPVAVVASLSGADAGNYTVASVSGVTVTINKIDWTAKSLTPSAKYGADVELDLTNYLAEGGTVGNITVGTNNVLTDVEMSDKKLNFSVNDDAALAETTVTITIPVTGAANYNDYTITVTLSITAKTAQSGFGFTAPTQTKTYGNADFTVAATGAVSGSTVTYTSSNPAVATVDPQTGKVTIVGAGETTITASATATDDYAAATDSYVLTVNKAQIIITANSYTIYVGDAVPTLDVNSYVVTGLVDADALTKLPTIGYNATPDNTKAGNYDIIVSGAEASGNYTITYINGELTITRKASGSTGVSSYDIVIEDAEHGEVIANRKTASAGSTVTLTVEPDEGYTLETLTVIDKNGDEIELTSKGNGKYTFKMPASKVYVEVTFQEDNTMLNFFVDVFASDYYYDAVLWAAENNITTGTSAVTFSPAAACTRAQAVTFLWRAAGCPAPESSVNPFTDVKAGTYYYEAVLWAVEQGITNGTSATSFSPDQDCSRAHIVTFLWRAQGAPAADANNPFVDVKADAYYVDAVLWAVEQGITNGTSGTTFSPDADCTRAQIVTFLYRYFM